MSRWLRIFVFVSVALAALATGRALATQVLLQTVEQMSYRSDAVVRAVPIAGRSAAHWTNPDGSGLIVTTTTLRVLESYQGDVGAGQEITIEHLGGRVGEISMMVPGMSVFRPDEEVVVFVQRNPDGAFHVLDLSMGKFEVARGAGGARALTRRDLEDAEVLGGVASVPGTLDALRTRVARTASAKAAYLRGGRPVPDASYAGDALREEGGR